MSLTLYLAGASGRMGRAVRELADADDALDLSAVPRTAMGLRAGGVLIDFTQPDGTSQLAKACQEAGVAMVTGTTGLNADQQDHVADAARAIPIVQSGNFSLGVNILTALVEQTAARLRDYDIEIAETHHSRKVDAPSGTALMLGSAAARGRQTTLSEAGVFARHGQVGARTPEEIGFSALRGGGVPGDHTVHFLGEEECLTLSHRSLDRALFARGALVAARWVAGQSPGLYSMRDVLGLD